MFAERILRFGEKFKGRLELDLLQGALAYVEYNEEGLAFEILCDHISECDVLISSDEYSEACQLAIDLGFDVKEGPFKHLENLVES